MKRILVSLFIMSVLTVSCQRNTTPEPGGQPITLTAPRIAAASSEFGLEFFKTLLSGETRDNVVTSPLSLHLALGMLLNGADTQTADELLAALRLKGYSPEAYNGAFRQLTEGLPGVDSRVSLAIANSVWYRPQYTVEVPFVETLKTTFGAEVNSLSNDATPVNQWVKAKTQGKIEKLYDQIDPATILLLINAVYFKGDWANAFDEKATYQTLWHFEDGRKSLLNVAMMRQENTFRYAITNPYTAVELPYGNGNFSMTLVLPRDGQTTQALASTFDLTAWTTLQQSLAEGKVIVGLPRFEFSYQAEPNLNGLLQKMGIRTAFTDAADLSKIRRQRDILVSSVVQKAYIKTDETGSEAAAVTGVAVGVTSVGPSKPSIILDRPFLFFIREKSSDTILFAGRVGAP